MSEDIIQQETPTASPPPQVGLVYKVVAIGMVCGMVWGMVKCEDNKQQHKHDDFMKNFQIDSATHKATIDLDALEQIYKDKIQPN